MTAPGRSGRARRERVAVVGLGAIGAMCLMHLARAGFEVTGFEAHRVGHDLGASGGPSRLFRMLYGEGEAYLPLLGRARELWTDLERGADRPLFYPGGAFTIGREDDPWLAAMLDGARRHDMPADVLDREAMARLYPNFRLREGEVGLLDLGGGILLTRQAIHAAVAAATRHGARVVERTPVLAVEPGAAGGATLTLAGGAETFDHVVVAAGPWLRRLLPELPLEIAKVSCTYHLCLERRLPPADLPPAMFMRDGVVVHACQPMPDGEHVKFFVGGSEPAEGAVWAGADPWAEGETLPGGLGAVTPDYARRVAPALGAALAGVSPAIAGHGAHYDGVTPDGHALLGPLPGAEGVVVASGMSLHGYKLAPAFGEMVARMLGGTANRAEVARFDPARFATVESRRPVARAF